MTRFPIPAFRMILCLLGVILMVSMPPSRLYGQAEPQAIAGQALTPLEQRIEASIKEITEKHRTVDQLTEGELADLPVGIAREIAGTKYVIAIDSAYSDEKGWFLTAYASLTLPGSTRPIAFAARNIAFHNGGIALTNQTRLVLVAPQTVAMSNVDLVLPADGRNYVEFDCNGFKAVNLKGEFLLPPDQFVPAGKAAAGRVKASFEINTGDLHNILAAVNITPFRVKGLEDFTFSVRNAVVDMSDLANPAGFSFPQGYQQAYGEDIALWRGFYLQEVSIAYAGLDSTRQQMPAIAARNLLIDPAGVSGLFTATGLLSLQNGSADGWPLSIDRLSVRLERNRLAGGGLAGAISIPFLGEDTLGYAADMEQVEGRLNYRFSVITQREKRFTVPLAGTVRLSPGSIVSIERKKGRLVPSALLNGYLDVDSKLLNVKNVRFERLGLTTQQPYITSGYFSLTGEGQARASGFPIRLDSLTLGVVQGQAVLGAQVALGFMETKDKGFSAQTYVQVMARLRETQETGETGIRKRQQWKLDKVQFNDIALNCRTMAFGLKGRLSLYNDDPVYGNGLGGHLTLTLKKILENGVQVNAYFGNKDDYRYWHVDAYLPTSNIPIVPPLNLNGILGGMSYHMVRPQPFTPDFNKLSSTAAAAAKQEPEFVFVPSATAGLSFMAGATLVLANDKAFNGDAVFEVAFQQGGGLKYVQFKGIGYFFTPTEKRSRNGETGQVPAYASVNMLYDNDNDVFHANMATYVNLAGVIRGTGPNGLVGEAVIHIDPHDWYLYVGRPSQPMGLDIAHLAVAQSYFMIGTKVEGLPLPPPEVTEIFSGIDVNLMRNESALGMGRGFATGARFQFGFDSKESLMPFYAALSIGAGADVMLRDFGSQASCKGRSGTLGIGGWYASGQAYVFMRGKVGIKVKGTSFDIVNLGAAALLQAKLPNPTWMMGALGGEYRILGGLIKGKFNLKLEVGEQCELLNGGNELGDIQVIADLKPDQGGQEVSVFSAPQVSFNTAIGEELRMMNNQDQTNTYRIQLDEFVLRKGGQLIEGRLEWNATHDVAVIRTQEILPPQSSLQVRAKLHWEKLLSNGNWEPLKENGQTDYEVKEASFTTGKAPEYIPDENVAYSYPIKHQYNFLIDEYGKGYVKLKQGQQYLFQPQDQLTQWRYIVRFQSPAGNTLENPLTYNAGERSVHFDLPQGLTKETIYQLSFVRIPLQTGDIDRNVDRKEQQLETGNADNTVTVSRNELTSTLAQTVEKEIYQSDLRTSQFARFEDKFSTMSGEQDLFDVALGNVAVIGKRSRTRETFDTFELEGDTGGQPLVRVEASADNDWYRQQIYPLLYEYYGQDAAVTVSNWRNAALIGTPPLKSVKLRNNEGEAYQLTENNLRAGFAPTRGGSVTLGYYLSYYAFKDYEEMRNKAAAKYLSSGGVLSPGVQRLLQSQGYTDLLPGQYLVKMVYTLPGTDQITTQKEVTINF